MNVLGLNLRRLVALVRKESLQVVRDPSAILIAFVLPAFLLFLYAFAVSLDIRKIPVGLVLETDSAAAHSLAAAFTGTHYFAITPARDRREVAELLVTGKLKGYVVIPQDFERRLHRRAYLMANGETHPGDRGEPLVQVIGDGAQPNTAGFVANYTQGVIKQWLLNRSGTDNTAANEPIQVRPRFWFNPEMESRRFLLTGSIAIIMTMIGTLLTALVVAREWERGTMEAMLSTPARVTEILLGKLIPYFMLGLLATLGSAFLATHLFGVPLRGSWLTLVLLSATFMIPALGQGLLISALAKNQFIASQAALFSGFLPSFLLSGFIFEIDSMPLIIRAITYLVPARYFIASIQTVFLAGDVWSVLLPNMAAMLMIGGVFLFLAKSRSKKSLD